MGGRGFDYPGPSAITREMAWATPIYRGVTLEGLESAGVLTLRPDPRNPMPTQVLYSDKSYAGFMWPSRDGGKADTPVLYAEGFPRGVARLVAPAFRSVPIATTPDFPFLLAPGRVLLQSDQEMEVEQGRLNHLVRTEIVQMHPEDAKGLGVAEGDLVEVESASQRIMARVELHANGNRGLLRTTGLFGQLAETLQRSENPDPMASVPGLAVEPARVRKPSKP
jgi:formate dehydrogenase major subunit